MVRTVALTQTKTSILARLASGDTHKAIAERLHISHANVAYHVRHMQRLFGAPNATAVVSIAFAAGILVVGSFPVEASGILLLDLDAIMPGD